MKEIFDNVSASPRLRRFTTSYLLFYFIITLAVNLLSRYVPVIDKFAGGYIMDFVVFFIDGALMYGLIRGIVTKDYSIGRAVGSFGEVKNYHFYLIYAAVNTVYNLMYSSTSLLTSKGGTIATLGWVITAILFIAKFLLNFALVRLYFEKILFGEEKLDISKVIKSIINTVSNNTKRIIFAELLILVTKYITTLIGVFAVSTMTAAIGTHWAISFVTSCFVTIQFGALIYIWPIYYLYYKETCEN